MRISNFKVYHSILYKLQLTFHIIHGHAVGSEEKGTMDNQLKEWQIPCCADQLVIPNFDFWCAIMDYHIDVAEHWALNRAICFSEE